MSTREPGGTSSRTRVCVIGPGTRFLSGITYYTFSLCHALDPDFRVSAVLLRRLLPQRLYPGHARVGTSITTMDLPAGVRRFDGVDWFWIPSIVRAIRFLRRERPDFIVIQWWTGTVLHSLLALTIAAKAAGARVVIEFHESLDTGEDRIWWFRRYVNFLAPRLFRMADRYVVHSEFDRRLILERFDLPEQDFHVIPHATYDHYDGGELTREAPPEVCNLLFFGIIRPFKGLEDLVRAFEAISADRIDDFWLTVVGETWEGWTLPTELIERSPYRHRITVVNRYVLDDEVDGFFRGADVVVLPYHRSSQSGPLHVAMSYGLPVVVTAVGGLVEAGQSYGGAIFTEPQDPEALAEAILTNDWARTLELYRPVLG
jgi:glycosyltransferase involved in cell wall biosynthesis